jgi:hypothetical protein
MEMADFKDIYLQWVSMKGWTTQESFPIKELGRSQLSISESEAIEDDQPKTALSKTKKTFLMGVGYFLLIWFPFCLSPL